MCSLLLPTTCFGHSFDHHQGEQMQVQNRKTLHKRPALHNQYTKVRKILLPKGGEMKILNI